MIRLEVGLEIRHLGVMSLCAIEDLPLLLLHHICVRRNPVHFKALVFLLLKVIGIRPMAPALNTGPPEGI